VTPAQITIFVILAGMLALFVWDRLRYDLVAVLALLAAVLTGVIPPNKAFSGFSNEVLPLIAGALAISAAIGNSGVVELLIRRLAPALRSPDLEVGVLVGLVTALSAFMKNIGALAIFLPVAIQLAQRSRRSPSELLMPLSFGSLIGGLATLIGTSPNLLISSLRRNLEGAPFRMFDFAPVGVGIALCGVAFLAFGWRLLPRGRLAKPAPEDLFHIEDYTAEVKVPPGSPMVGKTVAELEAMGEDGITIVAVIEGDDRRVVPQPGRVLRDNDVLVVESDPTQLASVVDRAKLQLVGSEKIPRKPEKAGAEDGAAAPSRLERRAVEPVEAVITSGSILVGTSTARLRLRQRFGVNLLAVSRRGRRSTARLHRSRLQSGDVVVLQGPPNAMPAILARLGCLPLAGRKLRLGKPRQLVVPFLILAAAMIAASAEIVPAPVAFMAGAALLALFRILTLQEIYDSIEWPILILLGALIPVGEAVQTTGATDLIAGWIASAAASLPPFAILGVVLLVTMLATPILHHAAAVIVMGPVAASLAGRLGLPVDPFLMAVAVGAGSDFLSPIGHQCNTLVLGPGGYRFGDYWRLGLPLSMIVLVVGVPLIMLFWPLR
jgi:di/tricarboxylate transporter